jgi:hypothetical protein
MKHSLILTTGAFFILSITTAVADEPGWHNLFDGESLTGWRASENKDSWRVEDGSIVADGPRSHLFYEGPVGEHDFRNFELKAEVRTHRHSNSGIFFHTAHQETGWPAQGYEVQVNNSFVGSGRYRELKCTGSLYGFRNIYSRFLPDGQWFELRFRVVGRRVQIWVNDLCTVDYLEPPKPKEIAGRPPRVLSHGTIALQAHDPGSRVDFRNIAVRLLPDDAGPDLAARPSSEGYGLTPELMDQLSAQRVPVIDYHVHLRGGMTVEKALARQAVTGVNLGVLKNLGRGWPIETDRQLQELLDSVEGKPLFVGLQVNDRDWMKRHAAELLDRLDYVLADTMIMPMPTDDDEPVKLWQSDKYTIDDPEAWMERYVRHNLRVLAEPISILANPTYLPPAVKDQYDELWTDARMRTVIEAAIGNDVALEINARSGLPHPRFIRMAKKMGAKFTFGTNNFHDRPIDMSRCFEAIERYDLKKPDLWVPGPWTEAKR